MRGRRRERLRVESRVHDTNLRSVGEQNRCGAHDPLRVPRPDPPLLPSIIFPLGTPVRSEERRVERALGCGRIFPWGQQAGATGEEAAEGRKCEGGAGNGFGSRVGYTIQTCDPSVSRTAVGPTILFECPAQIPRSFLRSFSLWARP